jgi:hypothetical protein
VSGLGALIPQGVLRVGVVIFSLREFSPLFTRCRNYVKLNIWLDLVQISSVIMFSIL